MFSKKYPQSLLERGRRPASHFDVFITQAHCQRCMKAKEINGNKFILVALVVIGVLLLSVWAVGKVTQRHEQAGIWTEIQ